MLANFKIQLSVACFILTISLFGLLTTNVQSAPSKQFKVMLFTKTAGFHHSSILAGVMAIQKMAESHYFDLDWNEDASLFTDDNLRQYDAIMFLSTTGDILNDKQQAAMERFIRSGKGFVGIHAASDTESDWEWYTKLVGHTFAGHPRVQTAIVEVENKHFPGIEFLPERFMWTEEWYEFGPSKVEKLNYILSVDEKTYLQGKRPGKEAARNPPQFHPVSWFHEYDGGRSFYTLMGHMPATYENKIFTDHIYGGLYWAATNKGLKRLK